MRTMRTTVTALAVLAVATLLAARAPLSAEEVGDAKDLFVSVHKCSVCHSVAAAGIERKSEKIAGPDLGGFETDDFDALARFLRKEEPRDDEEHKKTFKGTDEELHAILDWLGSLEAAPAE